MFHAGLVVALMMHRVANQRSPDTRNSALNCGTSTSPFRNFFTDAEPTYGYKSRLVLINNVLLYTPR